MRRGGGGNRARNSREFFLLLLLLSPHFSEAAPNPNSFRRPSLFVSSSSFPCRRLSAKEERRREGGREGKGETISWRGNGDGWRQFPLFCALFFLFSLFFTSFFTSFRPFHRRALCFETEEGKIASICDSHAHQLTPILHFSSFLFSLHTLPFLSLSFSSVAGFLQDHNPEDEGGGRGKLLSGPPP